MQGRPDPTDALTINPGAEVSDPRQKHAGAAGPTPSSVRHYDPSRDDVTTASDVGLGLDMATTPAGQQGGMGGISMDSGYAEVRQACFCFCFCF